MKSSLRLLALALCTAPGLSAQVVISEINLTPQKTGDTQWIEIVNLSKTTSQDISNWSLYLATKTVGKPQNYWFGFPARTIIAADSFIRVHWGEPISSSGPADIVTGDDVKNFLFGYGFEALDPTGGAMALLNTKINTAMNSASSFVDWVSWGSSGFKREDLAVKAKLWTDKDFITAPAKKESIALYYKEQKEPTPSSAFFLDNTPTPNFPNAFGANVRLYGRSCARGDAKLATLNVEGVPTDGNDDFAFVINNTRGPVYQEKVFLLINQNEGNGSATFIGCPLWVRDIATSFILGPFNADFNVTKLKVSLNFPGAGRTWLNYQACVATLAFADMSLTNGLDLFIGQ